MNKKKLIVLTGSGMSAESGLSTFRGSGGLWEGADVMDVASLDGWNRDPEKVLEFYNLRRRQLRNARPNEGHKALVDLEKKYDVTVITQNVDNLHEKAGSANVIHLHGELTKARPVDAAKPVVDIGYAEINIGDCDENGRQLRPDIVWFGELVPMMDVAAQYVASCEILLVIGTSLVVYPAAGLLDLVPVSTPVYVVDPNRPEYHFSDRATFITEKSSVGTPKLVQKLLKDSAVSLFL
ncbi:MAG: NAD-dependent deacylase [Balneolales bacterium]